MVDTLESLCRKLAVLVHRSPTLRLRPEQAASFFHLDERRGAALLELAEKQHILRRTADGTYEVRGH